MIFRLNYLHCSPVVWEEGNSVGEISVVFDSHTISIVLRCIATGYIVAGDVF